MIEEILELVLKAWPSRPNGATYFCDKGHGFSTPQGLGGHNAKTGHKKRGMWDPNRQAWWSHVTNQWRSWDTLSDEFREMVAKHRYGFEKPEKDGEVAPAQEEVDRLEEPVPEDIPVPGADTLTEEPIPELRPDHTMEEISPMALHAMLDAGQKPPTYVGMGGDGKLYGSDQVPDSMNVNKAVKSGSLRDYGIRGGINIRHMRIYEMPDGRKLIEKKDTGNASDLFRAAIANTMAESFGLDMPKTAVINGVLVQEMLDGVVTDQHYLTKNAEIKRNADPHTMVVAIAAKHLVGDTDDHDGNFFIRSDGDIVPIDLDTADWGKDPYWVSDADCESHLNTYIAGINRNLGRNSFAELSNHYRLGTKQGIRLIHSMIGKMKELHALPPNLAKLYKCAGG